MKKWITLSLVLLLVLSSFAQKGSNNMITESEVKDYIEKFPLIKKEMATIDSKLKNQKMEVLMTNLNSGNQEIENILTKYGFTFEVLISLSTRIQYVYQSLLENERIAQAKADHEASVAKIIENPDLSDPQKQQIISQLDDIKASFQPIFDQSTMSDLNIIQQYRNQLKRIIK